MIKVISAENAAALVQNGATVLVDGSGGGVNEPGLVLSALEARFLQTGHPAALTVVHPSGMGDAQGGGIGDTRAIEARDRLIQFLGKLFDLVSRAVNDDDVDVQSAQDRDVQQQAAKIVVGHNAAVDRDDEHAVAELGDVMKNTP